MQPGEREWIQDWIDDAFDQFVTVVAESRNLSTEEVRGRQALEMGLVDKMGNFNRAVELLASMTGIEGEPRLVYRRKPKWTIWTILTEDVREWMPALIWTYVNPYRY